MYKQGLALTNLEELICRKQFNDQPINQPINQPGLHTITSLSHFISSALSAGLRITLTFFYPEEG